VANVPATASQDSFSRLFAECGVVESVAFGVLKEGTEAVSLDDFVAGAVLDGAPTVVGPTGRDGSFAYVVFTEREGVDAVLRLRQANRYMLSNTAAGVWGMAGAYSPGCSKRRGAGGSCRWRSQHSLTCSGERAAAARDYAHRRLDPVVLQERVDQYMQSFEFDEAQVSGGRGRVPYEWPAG